MMSIPNNLATSLLQAYIKNEEKRRTMQFDVRIKKRAIEKRSSAHILIIGGGIRNTPACLRLENKKGNNLTKNDFLN